MYGYGRYTRDQAWKVSILPSDNIVHLMEYHKLLEINISSYVYDRRRLLVLIFCDYRL